MGEWRVYPRGVIVFSDPLPAPVSRLILVALVALISLAGCSEGPGGPIPYNVPLTAPDAPKIATLGADYKIAPMDTVNVKVFKSPDLTGDYQVDLTGHISLPLVGEVEAANLTTSQLDDRLTQVLGAKYFEHPDVSIGVKSSTKNAVTVDGSVKQAGSFPVAGTTSLMQAVALAGGTNEDANPHRVAVFRTIGGQRKVAAFDLVAIRRGQSPDPQVYPGDIVVVDGSKIKQMQKQILSSIPLLAIFGPL
jgi:polysaccharide export outer membrane protein